MYPLLILALLSWTNGRGNGCDCRMEREYGCKMHKMPVEESCECEKKVIMEQKACDCPVSECCGEDIIECVEKMECGCMKRTEAADTANYMNPPAFSFTKQL